MLTVCLSFDVDATSLWLNSKSPSVRSRGEFAAVAVPRLLDLLAARELPATFFIPGHTADNFTELVKAIAGAGHEIGHHGHLHENPGLHDEQGERDALERGFDALDRAAGVRPTGYRAPGWFTSDRTNDLLVEYGFAYDSSLMSADFTPFYACPGLVELPIYWSLDDFPMSEFIPGKLEGAPSAVARTRDLARRLRLRDAIGARRRVHARDASPGHRPRPSPPNVRAVPGPRR